MLEDILELILAQQAVVHEDADQVLADGLVYQQGRDRGIHAARQAEHDDVVSDLGLDFSDSIRDELLHVQFLSVVHILSVLVSSGIIGRLLGNGHVVRMTLRHAAGRHLGELGVLELGEVVRTAVAHA